MYKEGERARESEGRGGGGERAKKRGGGGGEEEQALQRGRERGVYVY